MPLRPLVIADLGLVRSWRNSPGVQAASFSCHLISADEHQAWFERISVDPTCRWFMFSRDAQNTGVGYFTSIDDLYRTATWGFYKAPGAPPGTGSLLCTELLHYAFENLPIDSLVGLVLPDNDASIRIHEKLGFRRVNDASERASEHTDRSCLRFRINRRDWQHNAHDTSKALPRLRP